MTIEVCSHYAFDNAMKHTLHLNDDNVEDSNMAFISIIGTPACLTYYLDEGDTKHYFNDHENVLNLDFDDIGNDVIFNGNHFKTMTMEQAEKAVDFIDKMLDKGVTLFMIHCRAGMSRSRAFGEFVYRLCMEKDIDVDYADRNDYTTMLNQGVLRRLEHDYKKKHKLDMYENEGVNYPEDLINQEPVVINRGRERYAWELNEEGND
jgi:protein-tyrosine phosphatase